MAFFNSPLSIHWFELNAPAGFCADSHSFKMNGPYGGIDKEGKPRFSGLFAKGKILGEMPVPPPLAGKPGGSNFFKHLAPNQETASPNNINLPKAGAFGGNRAQDAAPIRERHRFMGRQAFPIQPTHDRQVVRE